MTEFKIDEQLVTPYDTKIYLKENIVCDKCCRVKEKGLMFFNNYSSPPRTITICKNCLTVIHEINTLI